MPFDAHPDVTSCWPRAPRRWLNQTKLREQQAAGPKQTKIGGRSGFGANDGAVEKPCRPNSGSSQTVGARLRAISPSTTRPVHQASAQEQQRLAGKKLGDNAATKSDGQKLNHPGHRTLQADESNGDQKQQVIGTQKGWPSPLSKPCQAKTAAPPGPERVMAPCWAGNQQKRNDAITARPLPR